jgi:hypothetical protein
MKILLAIILVLITSVAFAGDNIIFAPVVDKPGLDGVDSYVIHGDGPTKVIHVISLEPVAEDSYIVIRDNGKSNVVIKMD